MNNRSKSYCYISSGFGEKEGGVKNAPQYKVSKKSPSTKRVNCFLSTVVLQNGNSLLTGAESRVTLIESGISSRVS